MKSQKNNDDAKVLVKAKCDRIWNEASGARKDLDWKWFMYDLFVSGEHYSKWDKNTQQIISVARNDGRPKVVINKVYTTLRSVRNYVLRNRPKAEVTPFDLTVEKVDEAVKNNKYLDFLHDKLNLRRKQKESLWHSLKYSDGFWQVLWDEDAGDGQGEIAVNVIDPYDIYWDPAAKVPSEARYVILAVRKSIEDLKEDDKYDQEEVKKISPDQLLASSNLKARLLQVERGYSQSGSSNAGTGETVIVKEHWYKEDKKIKLVTIAGDRIIREEEPDVDRLPFFRLPADIEPLSMYGQGWVKNLISPQKLLNRLESQIAEYNDIINRGKYVMDKGAGIRVINNENGQIIEKKRGYEVGQLPISPLSSAIFTQIQNANQYIEDIGGAHDASLGRIPTGVTSGKGVEALQIGDSNNLSEIVENLEEFLEDVYEYILALASKKYQFARNIIPTNQSGEREFIKIIGEDAVKTRGEEIDPDTTVIHEKNMVDVKITSWLAVTAEARRDVLKELYQLQAIDQQTLLEGYQIGSVADIIKRVKEQQAEAQQNEMAKEMAMSQNQAEMGIAEEQAGQPEPGGAQQAIAAIRAIISGQSPIVPNNVSPEFSGYIDQFIKSQEAQGLEPEILQDIQMFRDQVVQQGGVNAIS